METQHSKIYGCSKSSSNREVYSNTRKISNEQPTLPPIVISKRRSNKAQSEQKEGNNKDQRENKVEIKKTIEKINETKHWK